MNNLLSAYKQTKIYKAIEPYVPGAVVFLSVGPTLIGWVVGLWYYDKNSTGGTASFQHFSIFLGYMALVMFNQGLGFFILFKYQDYTAYFESLLALGYIVTCIYFYIAVRKDRFSTIPQIKNILDKAITS